MKLRKNLVVISLLVAALGSGVVLAKGNSGGGSNLNHLEHFLKYRSELLDTKIENCRKMLFEEGLKQYRSGDLKQAISIWRNILTFDSENLEVKKAIDRATRQSKNLERIKLGGLGSEAD